MSCGTAAAPATASAGAHSALLTSHRLSTTHVQDEKILVLVLHTIAAITVQQHASPQARLEVARLPRVVMPEAQGHCKNQQQHKKQQQQMPTAGRQFVRDTTNVQSSTIHV